MAEYYAVERSPEYLKHYGVKGMKWGVRKARERGNERALSRHYLKAQKKLAKLNRNADIGAQKAQQIKYAKRAGVGLGVSMLGTGGIHSTKAYERGLVNKVNDAHKALYKNVDQRVRAMVRRPENRMFLRSENVRLNANYKKAMDDLINKGKTADQIGTAAAIVDLGALGYAGYAGAKSLAAKRRQTPEGHKEAVAKRDEFKREMDKAFKGYKPQKRKETYVTLDLRSKKRRAAAGATGGRITVSNKPPKGYKPKKSLAQRFKNRKYFTNNDFKQAFKAAGLGMVMGPAGANAYLTSKKIANEIPANNNRHGKKRRR